MKCDWLKGVKGRPVDAVLVIDWVRGGCSQLADDLTCVNAALERLRAEARVQTVEEADRALADWCMHALEGPGAGSVALEVDGCEHLRELVQACRDARNRESEL